MITVPLATDAPAAYRTAINQLAGASPLTARPVLDVGQAGQIRAGHELISGEFSSMALPTPVGMFNLSDLTNSGTAGGALTNVGGVTFDTGILGAASTAAVFRGSGSTAQALYLADVGDATDPFRIRTGSFGCWIRTAAHGVVQQIMSKWNTTATTFYSQIRETNTVTVNAGGVVAGVTDVCDDRWHWIVCTNDGTTIRLYVDSVLDASGPSTLNDVSQPSPFNIGNVGVPGTSSATNQFCGRIDEVFVTPEVLTADQLRLLYAARLPHGLTAVPATARLWVTRRRTGAALVPGDFPAPSAPARLYNFTNFSTGELTPDQGSASTPTTVNQGSGTMTAVAGADGTPAGAVAFAGAHTGLTSAETGLPLGTAARSYGLWLKGLPAAGLQGLLQWGVTATAHAELRATANGAVAAVSGGDSAQTQVVLDGVWHHVVVVEDNAAIDLVKRKVYVDGRCVAGSATLASLTAAGTPTGFRIGASTAGGPFTGQLDAVFVAPGALTAEQVRALYQKTGPALPASGKTAGDHIEAMDGTSIYAVFDTLPAQHLVDLQVMP